MNAKWVTATAHKSGLSPTAGNVVQNNGSSSLAKVGPKSGNGTLGDKYTE